MTSLVTKQIIEQLKDDSHPPIILLDGAWGVGKTYLIEHELKSEIDKDEAFFGKYYYLSAYGMRNVTDFQDQIVSLFLSDDKKGNEYVTSALGHVNNIARLFGANKSEAGLIQGVMSGLSGAVRQTALQKLSKMTIVLDDLERLTDTKIIADILGTCLRFSEHNNLKIIVVANQNAISDKSKIEKTFSDIITLSRSSSELVDILSKKYKEDLDLVIKNSLNESLHKFKELGLDINNLRVLQRALNRILKLKKEIDNIQKLELEKSLKIITQQILGICLLSYAKSYTEKDFKAYLKGESKLSRAVIKELSEQSGDENSKKELSEKEKERNKIMDTIFNNVSLNDDIIAFCFSNLILFESDNDLINKFALPLRSNPLDTLYKGYFYDLSEKDFNNGVKDLETLIFDGEMKDYYIWIRGVQIYIYLINDNYIQRNKPQVLDKLKAVLSQGDIIDPSTIPRGSFHRYTSIPEELQENKFRSVLKFYINKSEQHKSDTFSELFYNNWQEAGYSSEYYYSSSAFLHNLNEDELCKNILTWKGSDVISFKNFIKSRSSISNAKDFYKSELQFIQNLITKLKKNIGIKENIKRGTLNELISELECYLKHLI